ncbi:MAG: hypothetical protein WC700_07645 [Gemmatimonadaceae bacterium]|jgi:hypothetical protein
MISIVVTSDDGLRFGFDIFTPVVIGYKRLLEFAECREGDSLSISPDVKIQILHARMHFISQVLGYEDTKESSMVLSVPACLVAEKLSWLVNAMERLGYFGEQRTRTYGNPLPTPINPSKAWKSDEPAKPIASTGADRRGAEDRNRRYQNFETLRF